jgi:glyoxylase-like metal-dependent hydrolase (beta-lactamase superfamily II)
LIIQQSGEIFPGFYSLYPIDVPVFLLDGEHPAVFDAGFSCLAGWYADQLRRILSGRGPDYCFITHSHFDHLGAVSFLKRQFPGMKICAHHNVDNILSRASAVERIRMLNEAGAASVSAYGVDAIRSEPFEPFTLDRCLAAGDEIQISEGLTVRVYHTPGHTRDCLSFYIPERKTLIASEALGIPDYTGYVVTDFLVDYDLYMDSMRALSGLDVEVLCFGHSYVYTGEHAKEHIPRAMQYAEQFFSLVANCLAEEKGDLARVKQRLRAVEYDNKSGSKQPEPAYLLNLEARILAVQKRNSARNSEFRGHHT